MLLTGCGLLPAPTALPSVVPPSALPGTGVPATKTPTLVPSLTPNAETPNPVASPAFSPAPTFVLPTPNATAPWRFDFPTPIVYPTPNNWRPPVVGVPLSVRAQDHFWFARPIASDSVNWPLGSYRYGADYFGQMNIHAGIDIDAPPYTPILAAGPGEVVWAGWGLFNFKPGLEDDPYGIAVAIKHDFGYEGQTLYTLYAHLTAENVFVGQQVQTGEVIGWVGSTGNSTGPHVHFEVRVGRNDYFATRNPELWIAPYAGWGVLAGQLLNAGGAPIPSTLINIFDAHRKYAATIYTYGPRVARPDDDWRENFAISDLPAGNYYLEAHIATSDNTTETLGGEVTVVAGQTNFVILQAKTGIFANLESPLGTRPPYLPSVTPTLTPTPSPTGTNTPTRTASPTRTPTRTRVPTNTVTPTRTRIPTHTPTPRFSPTPTLTLTPRPPTITPLVTIGPLP